MTSRFRRLALGLSAALGLTASAGAARADAIDGNWCYSDGRHMSIDGPRIVTPRGTALLGNYNRHYFSYVAPASEPEAGQTVFMRLLNENTVDIAIASDASAAAKAPVQTWHRCPPGVS